ncbi:MAG: hypothetical protein WAN34_09295 [Acidimicrobiia bacterium]
MPNDHALLVEGEGRLLLLISAFGDKGIEGRTKLAKLDFFIRYPAYLWRALQIRAPQENRQVEGIEDAGPIESRMIRYRYGPWDPSYFTLLGRLIGRGMVGVVPGRRAFRYRATDQGRQTAALLASHDAWESTQSRCKLVKRHLDLQGSTLKDFVYAHFPEVSSARWGEEL